MNSLTQFDSKNVFLYIHHSDKSKVTALYTFRNFRVGTSLNHIMFDLQEVCRVVFHHTLLPGGEAWIYPCPLCSRLVPSVRLTSMMEKLCTSSPLLLFMIYRQHTKIDSRGSTTKTRISLCSIFCLNPSLHLPHTHFLDKNDL